MATSGPAFALLALILGPVLVVSTAYPTLAQFRKETSRSYMWGKYFLEGVLLSGLFCDLVVNLLTKCFPVWKTPFC